MLYLHNIPLTVPYLVALAIASLAPSSALAQGAPAVAALETPPAGGDGYASLEAGAAFSTGAFSAFHNPATLGELYRSTGATFHAATVERSLLLPGTSVRHTGFAASLPSTEGVDIGLSYSRTASDYGTVLLPSDSLPSMADAYEHVHTFGLGVRLGMPVSVGGAVKFFESDLGAARATGWAYDVGLLLRPVLVSKTSSLYTETAPSAALVLQNLGQDVRYGSSMFSDPLPRTFRAAVGTEARIADIAAVSIGWDLAKSVHRHADGGDVAQTIGLSGALLGLRYSVGRLHDPEGYGNETHQALAYEFDLRQWRRAAKRLRTGDFASSSAALESDDATNAGGFPAYRPNLRFIAGRKWISENSSSSGRDGGDSWYFSVAL